MAHSENSAVFAAPPTAETPTPPPAHAGVWTAVDAVDRSSYRPARRLAMLVMAALAVASATRAMALASVLAEREFLDSMLDAPSAFDRGTLSDRMEWSEAIGWLVL